MPRSIHQHVATREQEARALELRQQGKTYEAIARELGFANRGGAHKAVQRALLATIRQPAEDVRAMEMLKLEEMYRALWPTAIDTQSPKQLQTIDAILKVMDRENRLLGLIPNDKPSSRRRKVSRLPVDDRYPDAVLVIDTTN